MAETSKIEWTDATWNPITGCSVVSPGCTNCYAMKLAGGRLAHHPSRAGLTQPSKAGPVWTGEVRFNDQWLDQPRRWRRPRMIFVCAHGDLFHEDVPDEWIDKVFFEMHLANHHTFQVLTKRPERAREYLHSLGVGAPEDDIGPLPNVWLGVSVEDRERKGRIDVLREIPAAVRFLSLEPLLEDLGELDLTGIGWAIVGSESGPRARPCKLDWVRSIRDQCVSAGVPLFWKQHVENRKKISTPTLDGRRWTEYPSIG